MVGCDEQHAEANSIYCIYITIVSHAETRLMVGETTYAYILMRLNYHSVRKRTEGRIPASEKIKVFWVGPVVMNRTGFQWVEIKRLRW